jgi:hypothetical protein
LLPKITKFPGESLQLWKIGGKSFRNTQTSPSAVKIAVIPCVFKYSAYVRIKFLNRIHISTVSKNGKKNTVPDKNVFTA